MENGRTAWEEMDVDCLVNVFSRLGLHDLALSVPLVCKRWRAAAVDPLCWKKLDFRRLELVPWSRFPKLFILHYSLPFFSFSFLLRFAVHRSCKSATELRFPLKFTFIDDLIFASKKCLKVKHVALPVLSPSDEAQIPELVGKWRDLERLEMESKPSNLPEVVKKIGLHCSRFSELALSASSIKEDDATAIARHLPELKCLELNKSYVPKESLLIIANGCRHLEKLTVRECVGFHGDDSEIMAKVCGIRDFRSEGCKLYRDFDESFDLGGGFGFHGYVL
ncbi:F-box/LRR-repeat protein [Apostasia shenzhenica]|uniref:F-box/LRR-repeat protein n=1 Tax=Apostasia shenzhenica TaxID=1088818 RepID=A0A2I0B2F2_9ASPA|nr:F-box/LRR-repeat protein [Apostasia shenzhenica]